jgi:hypothetical protein
VCAGVHVKPAPHFSGCCVRATCVHGCICASQVSEGIDFSDKAGRGVVITGEGIGLVLQHP